MTQTLPTPPGSPSPNSPADTPEVAIVQAIDDLLQRYLHLLDEQQKLQEELGKQLSAGFFSLARANHSTATGRRYGEDYYDDRMKATRGVTIAYPNPASSPGESKLKSETKTEPNSQQLLGISKSTKASATFEIKPINPEPTEEAEDQETPTDSSGSESNNDNPSESHSPASSESPSKSKDIKRSPNPLHWFGVLVPPALRNAQQSFSSAINGPVPKLASVVAEMREVEEKVGTLRGLLELQDKNVHGAET